MAARRLGIVTDTFAPGLLKYGLHRVLSSDTDDTDYEPVEDSEEEIGDWRKRGKKKIINESDSSDSESTARETPPNKQVPKRKRKRIVKTKRTSKKIRRFGDVIDMSKGHSSSDSDYIPEGNVKTKKRIYSSRKGKEVDSVIDSSRHITVAHLTPATNDTWSSLPAEILCKILHIVQACEKGVQHVCRCSQVCRNWNHIISQPFAWKYANLSFIGGSKVASSNLLIKLTKIKFIELRELNLCGWLNLDDNGLQNVAMNCSRLDLLNISNCQKKTMSKVTGPTLVTIAENCQLTRINFSNIRISQGYMKCLVQFIEIRGAHLKQINVSSNIALGSALLTAICDNCPELTVLDVSNTSIRSVCFKKLQMSCPKIQELYLANLSLEPKTVPLEMCPGFPDLRICSVANKNVTGWLTDHLLICLLKSSKALELLDIRGSSELTCESLKIPAERLERLYMSRCRLSIHMAEIISDKWSETLWDLDFSWAEAYATNFDKLIDVLLNGVDEQSVDGQLKYLYLQGTSIVDQSVKDVLLSCPSLEMLDLTSCRGIARGMKRLHKGVKQMRKLKQFYKL